MNRQYLEQALTQASLDKSKAETRQVIRTVFSSRDCVTLVRIHPYLHYSSLPFPFLTHLFVEEVT